MSTRRSCGVELAARRARAGCWLGLAFSVGCVDAFDGNGIPGTDDRKAIIGFEVIATQGGLELQVARAEEFSVSVSIDQNLIKRVETSVSQGRLRVAVDGGNLGDHLPGPHVIIGMPELTGIELRGAGKVTATDFDGGDSVGLRLLGFGSLSWEGRANELQAGLEGNGTLTLEGSAESAELYLRGDGTLDARDLTAQTADIDAEGGGSVSATVDGRVDARAGGTSSVELFGDVVRGVWDENEEGIIDGPN